MGDVRFHSVLARVRDAAEPLAAIRELAADELVAALAAVDPVDEAYLANVLATEAMNRANHLVTTLENVADGVVTLDTDGRVTWMNPAAARLLARGRQELRGRDFHDAMHHHRLDASDPDLLPERVASSRAVPPGECAVRRALTTGQRQKVADHDVWQRGDGEEFIVAFTAAPVRRDDETQGLVIVFRDVTRGRREHDRLRLFEAAVDRSPLATFWIADDGGITYANPRACRHLGYDLHDLQRLTVFDVDPNFTREAWPEHWERVRREDEVRLRSVHLTREGERVPVDLRITLVDCDGVQFHCTFATRAESTG